MPLCGSRRRCNCAFTADDINITGDGSESDPYNLALSLVPWTDFTPTFSGFTVGNGSRYGRYKLLGKLLLVQARFVFGSSSSLSGSTALTLPAGLSARVGGASNYMCVGRVSIRDALPRTYVGVAVAPGSAPTTVSLVHSESGNTGFVNSSNPITWAAGDELSVDLMLEVL